MQYPTFKAKENIMISIKNIASPATEKKAEWCVFPGFNKRRVILTAEHAYTKEMAVKKLGKNAKALLGDTNTGWLARLGALYMNSAYAIPKMHRIDADACKDPKMLGSGVRYMALVRGGAIKKTSILTHRNKGYLSYLLRYHSIIEYLRPDSIISVHGMSEEATNGRFDILLGFNRDKSYILGKKNAFAFRKELVKKIQATADIKLKIGISRMFSGKTNFILKKFVGDYNNCNDKKRIGLQAEFSSMGRKQLLPEYQIAVQIMAEMMHEYWERLAGEMH